MLKYQTGNLPMLPIPPPIHWLRAALNRLLTPQALDLETRFYERNIRVVTTIGLAAFGLLFVLALIYWQDPPDMGVFGTAFLLCGLTAWAVHQGRIRLAGGTLALVSLATLLDSSAAYWSPSTLLLNLLLSYVYLLILPPGRWMVVAVVGNLLVYALAVAFSPAPPALNPRDFYADPYLAILTTYLAHGLVLGVGYYIRQDQIERMRIALLLETERSDVLQQFLHSASHDLKTPLTSIKMSAYLLRRSALPAQQPALDRLNAGVARLDAILNSMLEMSALDAGADFAPNLHDLNHLLRTLADEAAPQAQAGQVALRCLPHPAPALALVDAQQITRAVNCVLENAFQHTPPGGTVTLGVRQCPRGFCVEVADTGAGIPPQALPHIFQRFYRGDDARTTGPGKAGLGLAIAQKIVELHQGKIEAESELGAGTTVRLYLPGGK